MPTPSNGSHLTVVSRRGCHLCVDAERIVARVGEELDLAVTVHDVDSTSGLEQYTDLVPVVLIDGRLHQHWRIDETRLRQALMPAASRWWRRLTR